MIWFPACSVKARNTKMSPRTSSPLESLDPKMLARLSSFTLRAHRIVDGMMAGIHRSPRHGLSVEFAASHRAYSPGDDLRTLDWKAFAKTDKLYVRRQFDDTRMTCQLVLDGSGSMSYRSSWAAMSKFEYAHCLAVSLSWLLLNQQDAVGLSLLGPGEPRRLSTKTGMSHLTAIINTLQEAEPQATEDIGEALSEIRFEMKRRGLVVVIGDLLDDPAATLRGIHRLVHDQQQVIVLQVLDPAEVEFPFQGRVTFRGLEKPERISATIRHVRAGYLQSLDRLLTQIRRSCHSQRVPYLLVRSDQPLEQAFGSLLRRQSSLATGAGR